MEKTLVFLKIDQNGGEIFLEVAPPSKKKRFCIPRSIFRCVHFSMKAKEINPLKCEALKERAEGCYFQEFMFGTPSIWKQMSCGGAVVGSGLQSKSLSKAEQLGCSSS